MEKTHMNDISQEKIFIKYAVGKTNFM